MRAAFAPSLFANAILDHRMTTKSYGRYFLRALPECAVEMFEL